VRAAFIESNGPVADVVQVGQQPEPTATGDRVLIEVKAATLNARDWLLVEGRYVFSFLAGKLPLVLCSDAAGVVVQVGPKAHRLSVGDEVLALQTPRGRFGALAELMAVRESAVAVKPAGLSFPHAAGIGVAGCTALQALRDDAGLQAGEHVVVVGASGGVGTFGVQIAKLLGGRVTGVCSGRNGPLVERIGADEVIDYEQTDFREVVRDADVVFDTIGRESLASVWGCLAKGGRYVTTVPNPVNAWDRLLGPLRRSGRRSRTVICKARATDLRTIAEWAAAGDLEVVVDSTWPLDQAPEAFARSRSKRARGKIVVTI